MNILCGECEELKPFYGENNCIHTVICFVVNWSFSKMDLEIEKTHPRIHNAEEKDEYKNDSVKRFK